MSLALVAGGLAVGLAAGLALGHAAPAVLAAACVWLAGWRCFVPAWFEIDGHGVREIRLRRERRIVWRVATHWEAARSGLYLHAHAGPGSSGLDRLGSLFVPFHNHRAQLLALIEYYMSEPRRGSSVVRLASISSGSAPTQVLGSPPAQP